MSNKKILIQKIEDAIFDYLESKYKSDYGKKYAPVLNSSMDDKTVELAEFANNLMNTISHEVYEKHKNEVKLAIDKEISSLIEDLFTTEEIEEVYKFIDTELGKKVLRNLDLFRDVYLAGVDILIDKIMKEWSDPAVSRLIIEFIETLEKDEDNDEGNLT